MAPGSSAPMLAWVESWFDSKGRFHSQARVADLVGAARPRTISAPDEIAAGVTVAGDTGGDEAVAYKACSTIGTCSVAAALRPAGGHFEKRRLLGSVDAAQPPALAMSSRGEALLGWIRHGHVFAASGRSGAGRFGRTQLVSNTSFGSDLALAFGPGRAAIAAWIQGSLAPSLYGAVYRVG
jgi:hypothetical protein